jgi:hypothetical protein
MHINLYHRTFPGADSPRTLSFAPDPSSRHHKSTACDRAYPSLRRVIEVKVPDGASFSLMRNMLCWMNATGTVISTAEEVFDLATTGSEGFQIA